MHKHTKALKTAQKGTKAHRKCTKVHKSAQKRAKGRRSAQKRTEAHKSAQKHAKPLNFEIVFSQNLILESCYHKCNILNFDLEMHGLKAK